MDFFDQEFAKFIIREWLKEHDAKDNDAYEFNDEKCDKMNDIIAYCQNLERERNCKIIRCMIEPKNEQGFVEVLFNDEFALGENGRDLEEFIKTLSLCDGVNITTNPVGEDCFQITFFVEDLWVPKKPEPLN